MKIPSRHQQHGVILVISLIVLVVISLLATLTVRNALSSEAVSGSVRLNQLATQAAEIALRYCEEATLQQVNGTTGLADVPSIQNMTDPPAWQGGSTTWDSGSNKVFALPLAQVNASGMRATYKRSPECLVERLAPPATPEYNANFIVTARGFGPEVMSADAASQSAGSEVFLQSTIEIKSVSSP